MTRTKLDGTTAVITGAGSGIGRATALLAAAKGARLVLTDVSADTLAETVRLVGEAGGTVVAPRGLRRPRRRRRQRLRGPHPRADRSGRRRHERRRHLHLGTHPGPLHRALAAHRRHRPDGPDPRARRVRAADDRGTPRWPRRQRLVGRRPVRAAHPRAVQRREVRAARRQRGAAVRPRAVRHRRDARVPGRRQHPARGHRRHRRRRPRRPDRPEGRRLVRPPCGDAGEGRRRHRPRRRARAATWCTRRRTSVPCTSPSGTCRSSTRSSCGS